MVEDTVPAAVELVTKEVVVKKKRKTYRARCTMCKEFTSRKTAHRHENKWVCPGCWDERLKTTE